MAISTAADIAEGINAQMRRHTHILGHAGADTHNMWRAEAHLEGS